MVKITHREGPGYVLVYSILLTEANIFNVTVIPLRNVRNKAEALFNESQIRTRNVAERSYGVWKRRFPALAMGMRIHLDTAQVITVATAILHNIACNENEQVPPVNLEQEAAINFANNVDVPIIINEPKLFFIITLSDKNDAAERLQRDQRVPLRFGLRRNATQQTAI
ncbi:hypothetical protein NQ317_002376 [Molorchus minor]|uniref:DDE Tnp4 domain-containing protein n=1 Tax=Molorchus minor TaxID=1323400 RepID=A0ABQ9IVK0_9CUCU|nr:hypothetical protein NQ317_002376 [Molorchus minor]